MMIVAKKIGPKNVAIMNHFDRTRSRYSRLMIAQSLAMSGHPLFDAARPCVRSGLSDVRADFLEEYLEKRRLDHLESLNGRARFDDPTKQHLRISTRRQLDLEKPVGIVCALHQSAIAEDRCDPLH